MTDKYITFRPGKDLDFKFGYLPEETKRLRNLFDNKQLALDLDLLRRAKAWKLDRTLEVPENLITRLEALRKMKNVRIGDPHVKTLILDLISRKKNRDKPDKTRKVKKSKKSNTLVTKGIGYPVASAFLKFINREVFPIIDVRAYRALSGKTLDENSYDFDLYEDYVGMIKAIHKNPKYADLDFWEIDEQLYCYDREEQKRVRKQEKARKKSKKT